MRLMNQSDRIHSFIRSFIHSSSTYKCCQIAWMCLVDQSNRIHSSILQAPMFESRCCQIAAIKALWIKAIWSIHPFFKYQFSNPNVVKLLGHRWWIKAILSIHPFFKRPFSNLNFIDTYCFNMPHGSKQYYLFIHCSSTHFPI